MQGRRQRGGGGGVRAACGRAVQAGKDPIETVLKPLMNCEDPIETVLKTLVNCAGRPRADGGGLPVPRGQAAGGAGRGGGV